MALTIFRGSRVHRLLIPILAVIILAAHAYAAENKYDPFSKRNAFSLGTGWTFLSDSDFADFWVLGAEANDFALSFERRIWKNTALELSLGYGYYAESSYNIFTGSDKFSATVSSYYASLSGKYYLPINGRAALYLGGGPDYYSSEADLDYSNISFSKSTTETVDTFGVHGLAGFEVIILNKPGTWGDFDAPFGLFVEYRYSWLNVDEADGGIIDAINGTFGTSYQKHDLNIGGHTVSAGIRWHF